MYKLYLDLSFQLDNKKTLFPCISFKSTEIIHGLVKEESRERLTQRRTVPSPDPWWGQLRDVPVFCKSSDVHGVQTAAQTAAEHSGMYVTKQANFAILLSKAAEKNNIS